MTPAEKLLALCEDVDGLVGSHTYPCHFEGETPPIICTCQRAERLKALKDLAAALKVCVEGLDDIRRHGEDHESVAARDTLSEAAHLASEGE